MDKSMDKSVVARNDVFTRQNRGQLTQSSARTAAVTAQGIADARDRRRKEGR